MVILAPQGTKAIFTLDRPVSVSMTQRNSIRADYATFSFELERRASSRLKYSGSSIFAGIKDKLSDREFTHLTRVPFRPKGSLLALFNKLYAKDSQLFIRNTLEYFKAELIYSLNPGLYEGGPHHFIERLLLERKKGLCGHFASAFAMMMRWGGIPSRVVVGYQGGEFNNYAHYWLVRQRNAHAWVEVYLQDHWERIDPTFSIFPERITTGQAIPKSLRPKSHYMTAQLLWDQIALIVETANYYWATFLLDFDTDFQKDLLWKLFRKNMEKERLFGLLLIVCVLFVFTLMIVIQLKSQKLSQDDRLVKDYQLLLKKIERLGHSRPRHWGPLELKNSLPKTSLFQNAAKLIDFFIDHRYGGKKINETEYLVWKRDIKRLSDRFN